MNRKTAVLVVCLVLAIVVLSAVGVGILIYRIGHGTLVNREVTQALERHDSELRAIPGVQVLGTHTGGDEPDHIVVWVDKITPEVVAAVPDTLDGFRVDVELEPELPPDPPFIVGVITAVSPATPGQTAAGIAGTVVIEGDLYKRGMSVSNPNHAARTLAVRVPADVRIWRPMGESKEFIEFADIQVGETGNATLTAIPTARQHGATATDLEAYGQ